jgi:putative ABC transport system permease protein
MEVLYQMKNVSITYLAFQNVRRRVFRGVVLACAICMLVALLVFAMSFVTNVNAGLEKTSDRLGADVIVIPTGARSGAEEFLLYSKIQVFYMDRKYFEIMQLKPEVEKATYQTYLKPIPGSCCGVISAQVIGIDQETDFVITPWLEEEVELGPGEIFIGHDIVSNYKAGLYDTALFFERDFKVAGTLEETGTGLDRSVVMRVDDMDAIIKEKRQAEPGQISAVFLKLKRGYDPFIMGRVIEGEYPQLDVIPRGSMGETVKQTLLDINKIFSITILLSSILSIFLAWAIFSAIVNERKREVGIIVAIGARRAQVIKLFLIEVLLIGGVGSIFGVMGGNLLSVYFAERFALLPNLDAAMDPLTVAKISILCFAIGTAICVLGALIPILKISSQEPLMAIREE